MIPDVDGQTAWHTVDIVATTLSIAGSLFMSYFCLILLRHSPSVHVKIVLSIAIADFLFSVSNALSNFEKDEGVGLLCKTEAIIRQTGFFMTIYFTVVAAVFASKVSKLPTEESRNRFFKKAVALGFLICLVSLLGPVLASRYISISRGPLYCQMNYTSQDSTPVRFFILMYYEGFAVIIGSALTLRSYLYVIREIKTLSEGLVSQLNIKVYALLWYPAVLFVSFIPCLLDSLYRLSRPDGESVPTWVIGLHILLPHSIGFTNAIVYGVQRQLYSKSFTKDDRRTTATIDITGRGEEEQNDEQELVKELLRAERLANQDSITC